MTMKKKNFLKIIFLAVLIVGTVLIIMQQRNTPYQHDTGFVFGTEYHITYGVGTGRHGTLAFQQEVGDHAGQQQPSGEAQ